MHTQALVLAVGLSILAAAPISADSRNRGRPPGRVQIAPYYYSGFAAPHYAQLGYDAGYRDGYDKGRDDARGRHARYDFARHKWFKSGSRGYKGHYGVKVAYQQVYRSGFQAGYDAAFRDLYGYAWRQPRTGLSGSVTFGWGW
jgi:hypothetical protein